MNLRPNTKAALLYLLPVLAIATTWAFLLYPGDAPGLTPGSTLVFVLTEDIRRAWFVWMLLLLPGLCILLAVMHLSRLAATRTGAISLFIGGLVLAAAAWLSVAREIALFVSLPLLYAGKNVATMRGGRDAPASTKRA